MSMRRNARDGGFCGRCGGFLKDFPEDDAMARTGVALLEPTESIPLGAHPSRQGRAGARRTGAVEIGDMS
jgi:hypothetical protein